MLGALREVGLGQAAMQMVAASSLDTQAGGALAGAAGLAAVDVALDRFVMPLMLASISALFSIAAILGPSLRGSGPSLALMMRRWYVFSELRAGIVLDDAEAEWMIVTDLELAIEQNAELLDRKGKAVFRATATLLIGLLALLLFEASR